MMMKENSGISSIQIEEIKKVWETHLNSIFGDIRGNLDAEYGEPTDDEEVIQEVKRAKNGRAPGSDEIVGWWY